MRLLSRIDAFDQRLFARLTRGEQRLLDRNLKRVSSAANRSVLWLSIAGLLAIFAGARGRRAAVRGAVAIGITSSLVNLPLKYLARRRRPRLRRRDPSPVIRVPASFSFPSGHSASAFAFATAAAREEPRTLPAILPLAATVAYSRVHLRVHYPLDVVAGAAIGSAMGLASGPVTEAVRRWWEGTAPIAEERRPPTTLILVLSPAASSAPQMATARRLLAEHGLTVSAELPVDQLESLPKLLPADAHRAVVVAAGGDGTVGTVADALAGSKAILGILPFGTSNDFARSIDIPMRLEAAVRLLSRGPITNVDTGRLLNDAKAPRHFVHAATVGLNVSFARFATRADLRHRLGRLTYAVAAAMALKERPIFACEVEHGGRRERLNLVHLSVVNAPVFGGFLDLKLPNARADDRMLHVIMVEHLPVRRLIRSALYPTIGLRRRIRGFRTLQVTRLTVRPAQTMDVTLDGEIRGKVPGTFEVVPGALRVIAPFERQSHP
jgi:undecaprenyl-diphosphatase